MPENAILVNISLGRRSTCDDLCVVKKTVCALLPLLLFALKPSLADDGAASIGAGGVVLMKREPRITMQKEVLTIRVDKVTVDYEFRNDSDEDITTGVAFPIPPYKMDMNGPGFRLQGFDDFKLTVEGKPTQFDIEARAILKGKDVTKALKTYGIDVPTFGHLDEEHNQARDVRRLSGAQRTALVRAGLLDADPNMDWAGWTVEKKYYWTQTFLAHTTTHISHSYSPVVGFGLVPQSSFRAAKSTASVADRNNRDVDPESLKEVKSVCPTDALLSSLQKASLIDQQMNGLGYLEYVDFILTTANTWKQPISDFTLFIERPKDNHRENYRVSLCWPGKVEQAQPNLFKATAADLVPTHELRIGFFGFNK
ncbi:MAG TPA: DUF4424 family protein [Acidobacteriaceae bacterium]|jgi:hypothetical protein